MPLQSCRIKDAFKTPGARRCESQGGVRGSVGGWGGGVWEGWRLGGGLVFSQWSLLKWSTLKMPLWEMLSEETTLATARLWNLPLGFSIKSILKVPLRARQQDEAHTKSAYL